LNATFIHGAAIQMSWRDSTASLSDLIFRGVSEAVRNSRVQMAEIDSVVLSAHDIVDGRSLSSMVTAPPAGAYFRDEIRLAEDGLAAASLASARIEAGETEYSIVAAWGRASEGDYAHTSRFAFDPFLGQPFGISEFSVSAMRLSAWAARHGLRPDMRNEAMAERKARAARNPRSVAGSMTPALCGPLSADEAPSYADIVVAAVIGRAPSKVRIAGFGHSAATEPMAPAALIEMPALAEAVRRAGCASGADPNALDVYQLAGATLADEAIALEALDLAPQGLGFQSYARAAHINPSGGGASGWCFPTSGLVNMVEAYLQLSGQAAGVQLGGTPKRALATGLSPMGGQVAHAAILEVA